MSRKQKTREVDTDKVRQQAVELGHVLGEQAGKAGELAASLAGQGRDWATDVAAPKIDKALRDGVKVAAPKIEAAAEKARPVVDTTRDRIVDDYLPRVQRAMHDAAEAAGGKGTVSERATKASKAAQKAMTTKPKKGGAGKKVGWILVGTAAAGTGYLLWRRTQPVDDPWAEEYWEDTTVTTPNDSSSQVSAVPAGTEDGEPAGDAATVAEETETEAGAVNTETTPIDAGRDESDVDTTRNA
ncbi:hypothetical protein SAMN05216184_11423 [Georgenia satyanarayanai]|uniref:Uncharacterized protein n=1 Tax=Georgenia satyanarayanai TaxID=860221 RepID=A0A2Y9ATD7_9MICO|nr:hypothetical protein [Georgenia satyanarayanai]PYF97759.1 hypothetical protein A8987_11423 [Georgenia satyanarayanai]SSA45499.1 hypothetical protein SAMN05216184_11423 [Georgenia satyanarayanai]